MLCSQIFSKQNYIHLKIPVSGSSILKFLSNFANFSLDTTDDLQCSWDSFQTFKRRLTWFVRSSPNQGCTVQTRPYQVTVIYCVACKLLKYLINVKAKKKKKNDIKRERNKEVNLQFWHAFKCVFFPIQCFFINYVNVIFNNFGLNHWQQVWNPAVPCVAYHNKLLLSKN